jgi:2-polyprenyl-3-methyl-5-hydroxy-6-metoxy-1,4-benzoquinol methylase
MKHEKLILTTWRENADIWIETIEQSNIPSRDFTSPAIMNCIKKHVQKSVLDIGCGEGWLGRSLSEEGFEVFGLDGTPALIDAAKQKSKTDNYAVVTFQEIVNWSKMTLQSSLLDQIKADQYMNGKLGIRTQRTFSAFG